MSDESEASTLSPAVSNRRDHIQGPPSAAVTLVEYGDYECPYCGAAYVMLRELLTPLGDKVRLVFRDFPLTQIHPHAQRAAEAAQAAGAQGKFWEMHDLLYEHQDALEDEDLIHYAAALELDMDQFNADLAQNTHADRIREDFLSGVRSGVNGTPTFFINGRRHEGPPDLQSMAHALSLAMNSAHAPREHRPPTRRAPRA